MYAKVDSVERHCFFCLHTLDARSISAGVGSSAFRSFIGHAHNIASHPSVESIPACWFRDAHGSDRFSVPQNRDAVGIGTHLKKLVSDKEEGFSRLRHLPKR